MKGVFLWQNLHFNSQPHEEADYAHGLLHYFCVLFQLTASRRGWPLLTVDEYRKYRISTHSLTKRLTGRRKRDEAYRSISTHSLTKRLTGYRKWFSRLLQHFNSQPHEEADEVSLYVPVAFSISTHSLTKRLTITPISNCSIILISTHSLTKRLTSER